MEHLTYFTAAKNTLHINLFRAENHSTATPCVVYLHGQMGFKDWGFVPYLGEQFAAAGFTFLAFNFSHNGVGEERPTEFTELERFSRNTYTLEVNEAIEIYQAICKKNLLGENWDGKLGVLGHSRGGSVALVSANRSPLVDAVVTWNAMATFARLDKKQLQKWRSTGFRELKNNRTGQVFHQGLEMLTDIEKNAKTHLNIQNAVRDLARPLLLVHAEADETIAYYEGETLNIYGDPAMTEFRLIPDTGHTFGTEHPFSGASEALTTVVQYTLAFFHKNLR